MASTGNLIGIFVGPSQHAEDIDVLLMGTNGDPVSSLEGESLIKCNHGYQGERITELLSYGQVNCRRQFKCSTGCFA